MKARYAFRTRRAMARDRRGTTSRSGSSACCIARRRGKSGASRSRSASQRREEHDEGRRLRGALDARAAAAGVPAVAVKSGAIGRALLPCVACVAMGDLDLLVPRGDFVRMHEVLGTMGFAVVTGGARADGVDAGLAEGGTDYALRADG